MTKKAKVKPPKKQGVSAAAKRDAFVHEYLIDLNKTQAAIRAGFSEKTAGQAGSRLFKNVEIQAKIQHAMDERAKKTGVQAEDILAELLKVARLDLGVLYAEDGSLKPIHEIPEDARRAIAGIEIDELWEGSRDAREQVGVTRKVKLWDKLRALELLGKHLKLFVDRVDHTSNGQSLGELLTKSWDVPK